MRYNDTAFLRDVIGMPAAHEDAFLNVARSQRVVIITRATGPTCLGPLEEGYDTKGYRIHGKSCDWGPMAGFVMRDPRLNKYGLGKAMFNFEKHEEALYHDRENQGWRASTTPLVISNARLAWLQGAGLLPGLRYDRAVQGYIGIANHGGVLFNYALVEERGELFSVCFDNRFAGCIWEQELGEGTKRPVHARLPKLEHMMAMTNPPDHGIGDRVAPHLKAITGDYDLFAVWPYASAYDARPGGDDHRPLGTVRGSNSRADRDNVTHLEENFTVTGQGTKLGNITNRIYLVCQLINSLVGRNVLWHSDESARPFLDDVDLPVAAFCPAGTHFGIESVHDFDVFIRGCLQERIHVTLSDAWVKQVQGDIFKRRLGNEYAGYVPADGVRVIVPAWYNR